MLLIPRQQCLKGALQCLQRSLQLLQNLLQNRRICVLCMYLISSILQSNVGRLQHHLEVSELGEGCYSCHLV
jgi:hypothetical protein